jgi:hypothetical protein
LNNNNNVAIRISDDNDFKQDIKNEIEIPSQFLTILTGLEENPHYDLAEVTDYFKK